MVMRSSAAVYAPRWNTNIFILDLDTLPVNNRLFRTLRRTNPAVCIIGLSSRPFHPELEEAMSQHIYACLSKPLDEEELFYWVKSLGDL
jgi:hypothetical protein